MQLQKCLLQGNCFETRLKGIEKTYLKLVFKNFVKEVSNYFRGANPLAVDKEGNTPFKLAPEPDTVDKDTVPLNQETIPPQNSKEK